MARRGYASTIAVVILGLIGIALAVMLGIGLVEELARPVR